RRDTNRAPGACRLMNESWNDTVVGCHRYNFFARRRSADCPTRAQKRLGAGVVDESVVTQQSF
ncbi:MAG: hypothetical protein ACI9MR_004422, partial [Myxococcota bacterium]